MLSDGAAAAAPTFLRPFFCSGAIRTPSGAAGGRTIRGLGDDSRDGAGVSMRGRAGDGTAGDDWRGTAFATSNCDASAWAGSKRWAIIGEGAFDGAGDADVAIAASVTAGSDGSDGRRRCAENARANCKSAICCAFDWGENEINGVAARDSTSPGTGRDAAARTILPLTGTMS